MKSLQQVQKYFSEVLGVNAILLKPQEATSVIKFIFIDEKGIRTESGKDLLDKMIFAMKLQKNEYQILEIHLNEVSQILTELESTERVICFSKPLAEFIQNNFPRVNLSSTYGPEALLKNPELKREVWELLKSLI
jgi:hypothetical protein